MTWETVIGLEVHIQLLTKAKIFSGAATAFGALPNTQACAIDLGLPGVLPVLNEEAVKMAVKFGLAINAKIASTSVFARKNYFYPDLPKGYQISQYELPIVANGSLTIPLANGASKVINITRAHLEEDAGKSLHEDFHGYTGVDLNRASVPLLEIVSEPELSSAEEAIAYLKTLHTLVRYLDICDGNMQEGSFRCDVNISIKPQGSKVLGTRAEIKNINSFRFIEKAINYEIARQIAILEDNQSVIQETRLYDPQKDETRAMRSKEEANDYRYFPDPDLLPLVIEQNFINQVKLTLPELPQAKANRFQQVYQLSPYDAQVLTSSKELADFYEAATLAADNQAKLTANWLMGDFLGALNKHNLTLANSPITAIQLGELVKRIADQTISGKIGKMIFEAMWNQEGNADQLIKKYGLQQVTDPSIIEEIIDSVIANNPTQVAAYKAGKDKLFGFFVGLVMKESKGKANPTQVNELLQKKLAN